MKLGIISDIHANKVALDAVLEDMTNVDAIVCCGDVVGYGPKPKECVETVREECEFAVRGNHDRDLAQPDRYITGSGVYEGLKHAEEQLSDEQFDWVTNLDRTKEFEEYLVVHSHPETVDAYVYPEDFGSVFEYAEDYNGIFLGHTHYQYGERNDDAIVLNPGSVGQPRDGDIRAGYAIVNTETGQYDLKRVRYDIEKVIDQIESAGLPSKNGKRLRKGE